MLNTLLDMLPSAIGVAISPVPIIAVIVMLMSKKAIVNGMAFVVGWMAALFILGLIVLSIGATQNVNAEDNATVLLAELVIGVIFLVLALFSWDKRPAKGALTPLPTWIARIETMKWYVALGLSMFLVILNPKNLMLTIAGMLAVAHSTLTDGEIIGLLMVFVVVASLTIFAPFIFFLAAGESAKKRLLTARAWLERHNAVIMALLLLVIGLKLTVQAVIGLA